VSVNHVDQGEEVTLDGLTVYKSGDPATAKAGVLVSKKKGQKHSFPSCLSVFSRFQLTIPHSSAPKV
jgi:hypothetical protein